MMFSGLRVPLAFLSASVCLGQFSMLPAAADRVIAHSPEHILHSNLLSGVLSRSSRGSALGSL